ncbi:MAG: hypothetical protein R3E01_06425 [Pirellulaceae bacterium]|nr:hypothetical protein [Planctomycetales bacterium]
MTRDEPLDADSPSHTHTLFGVMIGAAFVVDLSALSLMRWIEQHYYLAPTGLLISYDWIQYGFGAVMGFIAGQIFVLSVWTAIGPGGNMMRVLKGTLTLTVFWTVLILLYKQFHGGLYGDYSLVGVGTLIGYYGCQIPFWMLRVWRGWRMAISKGEGGRPIAQGHFTLLQMMGWSAYLALPLGLMRAVMLLGRDVQSEMREFVVAVGGFSLLIVSTSVLVASLFRWYLVKDRTWRRAGIVWMAFFGVGLANVTTITILNDPASLSWQFHWELVFILIACEFGLLAAVFISLMIFRRAHFRLATKYENSIF